jgi:hypothetical protein
VHAPRRAASSFLAVIIHAPLHGLQRGDVICDKAERVRERERERERARERKGRERERIEEREERERERARERAEKGGRERVPPHTHKPIASPFAWQDTDQGVR